MFSFEQCPDVTGTSLQGYLDAKMSDIVHAFGKPSVVDYDEGEKVSHCWDLVFTDAAGEPACAPLSTIGNITTAGLPRCQTFRSAGISAEMIPAQFGL